MEGTILKRSIVVCIAVFLSAVFALHAGAGNPNVEFKVKVSKDGFRDVDGQIIAAPFHVKKGESVRLTFLFDEKISEVLRDMMRSAQDQQGFVHAFALHSGKEIVAETQELSLKNRQTSLDFVAGDKGARSYKIYCTLMCFGMEHLNDLTIEVS
jgi:hypothetical protein